MMPNATLQRNGPGGFHFDGFPLHHRIIVESGQFAFPGGFIPDQGGIVIVLVKLIVHGHEFVEIQGNDKVRVCGVGANHL